jgi:TnpA family transposase
MAAIGIIKYRSNWDGLAMPRRAIIDRARLDALLALPDGEADVVRHYTLTAEELAHVARRRRPHNRFGFALQPCALRYPGRVIRPGETVPERIVAHLCEQLDIEPGIAAAYAMRAPTRYEHLDAIRTAFGIRGFTQPDFREMSGWLLPVALATTRGEAAAEALLSELRRRGVAAPGPTVIERLVSSAMLQADRHVAQMLIADLPEARLRALDALLEVPPGGAVSTLAWMRDVTGATKARALTDLIARLEAARALSVDQALLSRVHEARIRRLAQEGARLTAQHFRALTPLRRRAALVVTVLDTAERLTDEIVGLFDRLIGRLFRRAERRSAARLQEDARAVNDTLRLLADIGDALVQAQATGSDLKEAVGAVVPWERLPAVLAEARRLIRPEGLDYAAIAADSHALLRRIGPAFLAAFAFRGVRAVASLLDAAEALKTFYGGDRRRFPEDLPRGFMRPGWRAAAVRDGAVDPQGYELCFFAELRDRLRAGDVWVEGGRQYRAVEDQLIPKPVFAAMKQTGRLPVAAPLEPDAWLAERRALLDRRLAEVDARAAADTVPDVRIADGAMRIAPLDAAVPDAAQAFAVDIYARLPRVRITDLLDEVNGWTGFAGCFSHLRTGLSAASTRTVMTAVLADATNLGLTRMAEACAVASYKQLAWTAGWHIRAETYQLALARIVDAQQSQPLAAVFGTGRASSSDGQHFPLGGSAEVIGAVNPHKGAGPAISFYTHISDRYAPFHVRTISVAESEAAHVVDGLLHHGAAIDSAVHHADGGGVSDHVFGLLALLGFRFAPRIPNLHDRRLYAFGPAKTWPMLEPFIAGRVNAGLIHDHWDDLLRLASSIRTGVVSAAVMLRRLGAYPRQNGLALALREVGRIERTLYTLDWLEDPALRRQATIELNKGEARNALARAVCFHRLGRVRDRSPEALQHRAGGLTLVTAAIVLWNTVQIARVIDAMRAKGEAIPDDMMPFLSPLGWQHINLTGDYIWTEGSSPKGRNTAPESENAPVAA